MEYIDYTRNGQYGYQPATALPHRDNTDIRTFSSFAELAATPEFIAWLKARNDGLSNNEIDWQNKRDDLLSNVIIKYNGDFYSMPIEAQMIMASIQDSMSRRNMEVNWKCEDGITGDKKRVLLSKHEIQMISDAIIDACQIIHNDADTQMPVDPWPLELT